MVLDNLEKECGCDCHSRPDVTDCGTCWEAHYPIPPSMKIKAWTRINTNGVFQFAIDPKEAKKLMNDFGIGGFLQVEINIISPAEKPPEEEIKKIQGSKG